MQKLDFCTPSEPTADGPTTRARRPGNSRSWRILPVAPTPGFRRSPPIPGLIGRATKSRLRRTPRGGRVEGPYSAPAALAGVIHEPPPCPRRKPLMQSVTTNHDVTQRNCEISPWSYGGPVGTNVLDRVDLARLTHPTGDVAIGGEAGSWPNGGNREHSSRRGSLGAGSLRVRNEPPI